MSSRTTSSEAATLSETQRRPGPAGRRAAYVIGITVNLVLYSLVNDWPGWRAVPVLTPRMEQVLPLFNTSLIVGAVVNLLLLILDRSEAKAAGDVVTTAFAVAVSVQLWQVFPFDFRTFSFDANAVARVVLVCAIAGAAIALVVQLVVLVRLSVRAVIRGAGNGRAGDGR